MAKQSNFSGLRKAVEQAVGFDFGNNNAKNVDALAVKLATNSYLVKGVIDVLAEQGLPQTELKKSSPLYLAKAYTIPSYLRGWRRRVNPSWELLNEEYEAPEIPPDFPSEPSEPKGNTEHSEPAAQPSALPPAAPPAALEQQIAQTVSKILASQPKLDQETKDTIRKIAHESTQAALAAWTEANAKPRVIEILNPVTAKTVNVGLQHEKFPTLLRAAQARDPKGFRLNIWLTGPTGSGKTTAAQAVAKALSLDFGSDGSLDADYKVLGFRDANGHIVSTQFLKIYENGGIYLADEIDNWLPSALLSLNAALANGFVSTPGGLISRHKDCLVIACANTWGHGATNEYVGRAKQDAATLDRFQPKIHWPVDTKLEGAIAEASFGSAGRVWHDIICEARQKVADQGLKIIISPRATFSGLALLSAGFPLNEVMDMTFLAGLSPAQVNSIKPSQTKSLQFFALINGEAAAAAA